jgi:hypothetical protein
MSSTITPEVPVISITKQAILSLVCHLSVEEVIQYAGTQRDISLENFLKSKLTASVINDFINGLIPHSQRLTIEAKSQKKNNFVENTAKFLYFCAQYQKLSPTKASKITPEMILAPDFSKLNGFEAKNRACDTTVKHIISLIQLNQLQTNEFQEELGDVLDLQQKLYKDSSDYKLAEFYNHCQEVFKMSKYKVLLIIEFTAFLKHYPRFRDIPLTFHEITREMKLVKKFFTLTSKVKGLPDNLYAYIKPAYWEKRLTQVPNPKIMDLDFK